jgi:transposase
MGKKKHRRKRRAFTAEFKAEAVRLCRLGDRSIAEVAKDLDLTETALRDWVKRAAPETTESSSNSLSSAEREELQRLRRENKRLHMEREILRKAAVGSTGQGNTPMSVSLGDLKPRVLLGRAFSSAATALSCDWL